jgi:hypothetical protein
MLNVGLTSGTIPYYSTTFITKLENCRATLPPRMDFVSHDPNPKHSAHYSSLCNDGVGVLARLNLKVRRYVVSPQKDPFDHC